MSADNYDMKYLALAVKPGSHKQYWHKFSAFNATKAMKIARDYFSDDLQLFPYEIIYVLPVDDERANAA